MGLAAASAALIAAGPRDAPFRSEADAGPAPGTRAAVSEQAHPSAELVSAPVRIADAAAVRLLRTGDLVDVIAADGSTSRVVASGARVTELPGAADGGADGGADEAIDIPSQEGALVVVSVPRTTAAKLAGAGATARLAVTVC